MITSVRRYAALFGLCVALGAYGAPPPADGTAARDFTLGIFPYVSTGQIVEFHEPLRAFLSQRLERPVIVVSAPDFVAFAERTRHGDYDMVITAPHMGRLAERRDGYRRLVQTLHQVQGIFLVPTDSPMRTLADLRGKRVMIAARTSIIYQMAEETLRRHGLVNGRDYTIVETRTHNNAMYAPLRGEADASVTGTLLWAKIGDEYRDRLRVLGTTPAVPGFTLMANPRLSERDLRRLREALLAYPSLPASRAYFEATGFEGFAPISDAVMRGLDPYTRVFEPGR